MLDLIMGRRSVRKYKELEVEKEKIDLIVKGALTAPSGRNLKPCQLVVVTNRDDLIRLSKSRGQASKFMADAGVGFVVMANTEGSRTWVSDCAITSTFIQLLGESQGLKSCWIHAEAREADDGSDMEDNIRKILNIPANFRIHSMISMGYPDENKPGHREEDLDYSRIHFGKF